MRNRRKSYFSSDEDDLETVVASNSRRKLIIETDEEDTDALGDDVGYADVSTDEGSIVGESDDENQEEESGM